MIQFAIGRHKYEKETINETLTYVASRFGCSKAELTCESAEPVHGGVMVWVWHGEFNADTAASLFVPTRTYRRWRAHKGVCRLQ